MMRMRDDERKKEREEKKRKKRNRSHRRINEWMNEWFSLESLYWIDVVCKWGWISVDQVQICYFYNFFVIQTISCGNLFIGGHPFIRFIAAVTIVSLGGKLTRWDRNIRSDYVHNNYNNQQSEPDDLSPEFIHNIVNFPSSCLGKIPEETTVERYFEWSQTDLVM